MKNSPRNKMINTRDEEIKTDSPKKKLKKFFFPQLQKTVEAESLEEAQNIINKDK